MANYINIKNTGKTNKAQTSINNKVIGQIIGIGAVAGMRATFAPAIISHYSSKQSNNAISSSKLSFITAPFAAIITKALSGLEIAGDKLPKTPNRTVAPQLLARVASGAFAGAVIARVNNQNIIKGILLGGTSALVATFGTFYLRKYIDTLPHVKDVYTGAAEDMIALGTGILLMR